MSPQLHCYIVTLGAETTFYRLHIIYILSVRQATKTTTRSRLSGRMAMGTRRMTPTCSCISALVSFRRGGTEC
jgi:hypothetical protein